ncbi:hypothetical protein ACP4J4_10345 [Aureimonas ureilytica]|uniref:hypothetical protein n=1 Tax=Aureimonas ureilytica TaxID=401562 RepID=UPI003CEB8654
MDWLSARGALPDVAEHDGARKGNLVSLRCLADERNPTLEEASEAASVLLMCNGADLDFWSKGVLPDESFEEAAKNIQRAARSASREGASDE